MRSQSNKPVKKLTDGNLRELAIIKHKEAMKMTNPAQRFKMLVEVIKTIPKGDLDPQTIGSQTRIVAQDSLLELLANFDEHRDLLGENGPTLLSLSTLLLRVSPQEDSYHRIKGVYYWSLAMDKELAEKLVAIGEQEFENDIYRRDACNQWEQEIAKVGEKLRQNIDIVKKLMNRNHMSRVDPNIRGGLSKEEGWMLLYKLWFQCGNIYRTWSELDDDYCEPSIECYKQAEEYAHLLKDESLLAGVFFNIGSLNFKLKQYGKAVNFLLQDLKITEGLKNHRGLVQTLTKLADCYEAGLEMSKAESCLKRAQRSLADCPDKELAAGLLEDLKELQEQHHILASRYDEMIAITCPADPKIFGRPLQSLTIAQVFRYCELVKYCNAQTDFIVALKMSYPELTQVSSTGRSEDNKSMFTISDIKDIADPETMNQL